MTNPPRFEPRRQAERPPAAGARRVGGQAGPEHTRAMPAAHEEPVRATPRQVRPATQHVSHRGAANVPPPARRQQPPTAAASMATRPPATQPEAARTPVNRSRRRRRRFPVMTAVVLAIVLAWPIGLLVWADGKITHISALSGAARTPGTTYLLVGSDSRADGTVTDGALGERADTILVLHRAPNGAVAMISLPRDTYVQIEGYGGNKLNASYAFGGAPLLVSTVEGLTGLTVDHYVEIGMGGVVSLVDAVGGVNLCLDYDVNDELSQLVWEAGCHDVDGTTALAFARMRYSDPLGDIGRQARQRQVIAAVVREVATPATLLNPFEQIKLVDAGTGALATDEDSGIVDLARLGLAFRSATGENGVTGGPPIADFDYHPGRIGSTVLLDESLTPEFFEKLRDGSLIPGDVSS